MESTMALILLSSLTMAEKVSYSAPLFLSMGRFFAPALLMIWVTLAGRCP